MIAALKNITIQACMVIVASIQTSALFAIRYNSKVSNRLVYINRYQHSALGINYMKQGGNHELEIQNDSNYSIENGLGKVMQILSANFKSHALYTFIQLDIPNIIGDKSMSINEIASEIRKKNYDEMSDTDINQDALLRTMRLLKSIDILYETIDLSSASKDTINISGDENFIISSEADILSFQLSPFGKLFLDVNVANKKLSGSSLSSCVYHWMEKPLQNAWYQLPDYIMGNPVDPFELENLVSSDHFYNKRDNPQSLKHANDFVKLISDLEINSIVEQYDWSKFEGKTIIDIGGYNGKVMGAIASHYSNVNLTLKSLDLPEVIASIDKSTVHGVELIEGDIMKPFTIPECDVIFMKHFLDRCMWNDKETVDILKVCSAAVSKRNGMIVIAEAVIPSANDVEGVQDCTGVDAVDLRLSLDALYMLVGRERQRTRLEWKQLVEKANLQLDNIISTSSPSCYLLELRNKLEN